MHPQRAMASANYCCACHRCRQSEFARAYRNSISLQRNAYSVSRRLQQFAIAGFSAHMNAVPVTTLVAYPVLKSGPGALDEERGRLRCSHHYIAHTFIRRRQLVPPLLQPCCGPQLHQRFRETAARLPVRIFHGDKNLRLPQQGIELAHDVIPHVRWIIRHLEIFQLDCRQLLVHNPTLRIVVDLNGADCGQVKEENLCEAGGVLERGNKAIVRVTQHDRRPAHHTGYIPIKLQPKIGNLAARFQRHAGILTGGVPGKRNDFDKSQPLAGEQVLPVEGVIGKRIHVAQAETIFAIRPAA